MELYFWWALTFVYVCNAPESQPEALVACKMGGAFKLAAATPLKQAKCLGCLDINLWRVFVYGGRKWKNEHPDMKLTHLYGNGDITEYLQAHFIGICHSCRLKINSSYDMVKALQENKKCQKLWTYHCNVPLICVAIFLYRPCIPVLLTQCWAQKALQSENPLLLQHRLMYHCATAPFLFHSSKPIHPSPKRKCRIRRNFMHTVWQGTSIIRSKIITNHISWQTKGYIGIQSIMIYLTKWERYYDVDSSYCEQKHINPSQHQNPCNPLVSEEKDTGRMPGELCGATFLEEAIRFARKAQVPLFAVLWFTHSLCEGNEFMACKS